MADLVFNALDKGPASDSDHQTRQWLPAPFLKENNGQEKRASQQAKYFFQCAQTFVWVSRRVMGQVIGLVPMYEMESTGLVYQE